MTTTNLKQFLTNEKIPHYLIWYYTTPREDGLLQKHPIGEKNNETVDKVNSKSNINPPKPNSYSKKIKEGEYTEIALTEAEKQTLQKTYTCFLKHTPDIYCIDVDMESITSMDEFLEETCWNEYVDNLDKCPYTKGNTKGIHIYLKITNMPEYGNQVNVFSGFTGDLLKVNNVWERTGKEIYNYSGSIPEFTFLDINHMFNFSRLNLKSSEPAQRVIQPRAVKTLAEKTETYNIIEKLIKCFSEERATSYTPWLNTMFMIANELDEDGEDLFIEFSKKSSKHELDEYENRNRYREYLGNPQGENKKLIRIGSGIHWAKEDNKTLYDELFKKTRFSIFPPAPPIAVTSLLTPPIDIPTDKPTDEPINYFITLEDLADVYKTSGIITKTLKKILVLCNEEWFMLDNKTQLWRKQKEPSFYVITEIRKYIDYSNKAIVDKIATVEGKEKEDLIELSKKYLSSYNRINQPSYFTVIIKLLRPQLADDTFSSKLDNNAGMLAFKNGIYDLKDNTGKAFREGILPSDFITDTIPFDYEKPDATKKEFLRGKLKEIMNNNDEHLNYWLSIIGYSFIGNAHLEKAFYCCIDGTDNSRGDNGKTLFYEILTTLFPCYVYKSDCSLIENDNKKAHKQLVRTKGKRLVWVDEYKQNKKADYALLKQLAEGKTKENEVMFGTTETLKFMFKLFILSNHKFTIPAVETAVYNRYNEIPYTSHFDRTGTTITANPEALEFIADVNLMDSIINDYKNEVVGLITEYAHKYFTSKLPPIPQFFKSKTLETMKHNDRFIEWFEENCEACVGEKVPLKRLVNSFGNEKELKEGMTRMGFKYMKDLRGMGKDESGKPYKGGYEGIKQKQNEDDEDLNQP